MTAVPTLLKDTAGALSYAVAEGTPSNASVVIYDENGTQAETPAVTVLGATLSCAVAAGTVDAVASTYRARWTYTAGGVVYVRDQRFQVRVSIAAYRLTTATLTSRYYPVLTDRFTRNTSSWQAMIDAAWVEMTFDLQARSIDVNRIIDVAPLERAHAALAAHRIALNYSLASDTTSPVQGWADDRRADYVRFLDAALSNLAWYQTDDDLLPGSGETNVNMHRLRMSR